MIWQTRHSKKVTFFCSGFSAWANLLGKITANTSPNCPITLQHTGNNLPLETSLYLLFFLQFWGCRLCEMEQREGLPELVTSAGGWAQVCSCSTLVPAPWETHNRQNLAPVEFCRSWMSWYQDCRLTALPRHNKKELFHGGGI